jgi:hypothetical protein
MRCSGLRLAVVHPHHDGGVDLVLAGHGEDDALGPRLQVTAHSSRLRKAPVASTTMSTVQRLPGELRGIALLQELRLLRARAQHVPSQDDLPGIAAVHGVEAEEIGEGLVVREIVRAPRPAHPRAG